MSGSRTLFYLEEMLQTKNNRCFFSGFFFYAIYILENCYAVCFFLCHRKGHRSNNVANTYYLTYKFCVVINRWLLLYVYIPLLESELTDLRNDYNAHKIRKQKGKLRPDGIPDDMFYFPEKFGRSFFHYF